jgi:hypothetical protein
MTKAEFIQALRERYEQWEGLLDEIGLARMERPGVNGAWTMKDLVGHMTGWQGKMVTDLEAAQRGEAEPPPPWPVEMTDEDGINGWIYEAYRGRSAEEVLAESRAVFEWLFAVIEGLPEDVRIEQIHGGGHVFNLLWVGGRRFNPGEMFDHFRDDHEPDVRAWLAGMEEFGNG